MRQRLAEEYLRLLREGTEERASFISDELFYLFRELGSRARLGRWTPEEEVHERRLQPDDIEVVLRMAEETEGPASVDLVRYWLERQPQGFGVFRSVSTGETVAFTGRLVLPAPPDPQDLATAPVVAAAWEYTAATAPVSPGEHIAMTRFSIYPDRYQAPSRVIDLSNSRAQGEAVRARSRAHGFVIYQDADAWAERLKGVMHDTGARPRVGEHSRVRTSVRPPRTTSP
ncbi:hypothetical protein ACFV98_24580 [Streptomyces violascens]|uniref:hypothetical protein n=1 Tax=Streptomyces violascens TaxID=67381 RepID=UPI00364F0FA0